MLMLVLGDVVMNSNNSLYAENDVMAEPED